MCPFHEGSDNPTGFVFSVDKGFGYCFTNCHKHYSIFDVVMVACNYSFIEAVYDLADRADMNVNLKSFSGEKNDNLMFLKKVKKVKSQDFYVEYEPFSENILKEFVPNMHTKLREEGFDHDVREYFNLGFCRDGYLQNRITIPVDSIDGDIVTVSGRSILSDEELEFQNIKKYLIYFETDKSKTLYNISRAIPYIELLQEVIVVEGFKSVWRLHQWGIRNVVAVMGSTISYAQVVLLLKLGAKVIVCGDRDKAGKKLNHEVVQAIRKYNDVAVMDMFSLDIPEKSSISDITKEQYEYLYNHRKEII